MSKVHGTNTVRYHNICERFHSEQVVLSLVLLMCLSWGLEKHDLAKVKTYIYYLQYKWEYAIWVTHMLRVWGVEGRISYGLSGVFLGTVFGMSDNIYGFRFLREWMSWPIKSAPGAGPQGSIMRKSLLCRVSFIHRPTDLAPLPPRIHGCTGYPGWRPVKVYPH